ncbi:AI-2E family transporter [Novosphingobium sp. BL-8A]|uniref:AI-2E family transporter n=1 Tax=Novosphingobium sp. BL-8A TaxID=3127639 RepID=UPI0037580C65
MGLTVVILIAAFWVAFPFLKPVAWAVILTVAEWPLYRRALDRRPNRRGTIAVGFALGTALFFLVPLSIGAAALVEESQAGLDWLKHIGQSGMAMPPWLPDLPLIGGRASRYWQAHLARAQSVDDLLAIVSTGSVLTWTQAIGMEIVRKSATVAITAISLASLLWHGEVLVREGRQIAIRIFGTFGGDFLTKLAGAVRATVTGTILVSFCEGALIGVGYAIAGVPQPILFAAFTIALALIPFGAWAAFGLASLILIAGGNAPQGVALFLFGAMVMTIGDNVIQPTVVGRAVKLPFLLAMIGAFGGLAAMGLIGLFIGPVVMAALLLVWQHWLLPAPSGQSIPNAQA